MTLEQAGSDNACVLIFGQNPRTHAVWTPPCVLKEIRAPLSLGTYRACTNARETRPPGAAGRGAGQGGPARCLGSAGFPAPPARARGKPPACHRPRRRGLNRARPPDSDSGPPQRLASLRERGAGLLAEGPWPHAHSAWPAFGVPALLAWLPCVAVKIHRDCAPAACQHGWARTVTTDRALIPP